MKIKKEARNKKAWVTPTITQIDVKSTLASGDDGLGDGSDPT